MVPAKEFALEAGRQIQQPVHDSFGIGTAVDIVSQEDNENGLLSALAVLSDVVEQLVKQIAAAMDIAYRIDPMIGWNRTGLAFWPSPQT